MNNSKIALENIVEPSEQSQLEILQRQQGEFTQLVEAINRVESSEDWQKLKRLLLDGVVSSLEKQLSWEAKKDTVNAPEIYRLQGQLAWAKKYADLKKLSDMFRQQIENLKNQIKHEENPRDGAL